MNRFTILPAGIFCVVWTAVGGIGCTPGICFVPPLHGPDVTKDLSDFDGFAYSYTPDFSSTLFIVQSARILKQADGSYEATVNIMRPCSADGIEYDRCEGIIQRALSDAEATEIRQIFSAVTLKESVFDPSIACITDTGPDSFEWDDLSASDFPPIHGWYIDYTKAQEIVNFLESLDPASN